MPFTFFSVGIRFEVERERGNEVSYKSTGTMNNETLMFKR